MMSEARSVDPLCRLDADAAWAALARVREQLARGGDAVAAALDGLLHTLGADRGLIARGNDCGTATPIIARRAGRPMNDLECEEISASTIRQAALDRRMVVRHAAPPPELPESFVDLEIRTAIAAWADGGYVIYADFRDRWQTVTDTHTALLVAAGALIGAALRAPAPRREQPAGPEPQPEHEAPSLEELTELAGLQSIRRDLFACVHGSGPVLIVGESGTGKTLLAAALARRTGRTPVIRAMLGVSDDLNTIASELFGHERGAFSGATTKRIGLVEHADGGTLVLDEVLNLPKHAQQLLLDFTQFGMFRPLGHDGSQPRRSCVRIVAVTNGDLEAAVEQGRFRRDLYYRLAGTVLRIPPLRERRGDIPTLARTLLRRIDPTRDWRIDVAVRRALLSPLRDWKGNVRELEALLRRARDRALLDDADATTLRITHLDDLAGSAQPPAPITDGDTEGPLAHKYKRLCLERAQLEAFERELLQRAIDRHGGVLAHAARELGLPRTTLISRMKRLDLKRP